MVRPLLKQQRKAAGIYYTPAHIVEPIVEATVGELCRGKTPAQIARLRIIDPACGDGRFLLGAYRHVLGNHVERILHGVDIDPRAVELARTSLGMRDNIRCADSLRETERGVFDAVIGNPPFGAQIDRAERIRLARRYPVFARVPDSFVAFIERAFELLKPGGRFGFVLPSAWLGGPRYRPLREFLLSYRIESVKLLPFDSFPDAYVDTAIVIASKAPPRAGPPQKLWRKHPDRKFILDADMAGLLSKIAARVRTRGRDLFGMKRGVLFDPGLLSAEKSSKDSHRYFEGSVYRYRLDWSAPRWVEFGPRMKERPRSFSWFEGKRILLRRLVNRKRRLMAAFTDRTAITNKNLYSIRPLNGTDPYCLLGILNSRLVSRLYLSQVAQAVKDDFPQLTIRDVLDLPLPQSSSRRLSGLVRQMLAEGADEIDGQIDRVVYDLYGLDHAEIGMVEGHQPSSS